MKRCKPWFVKVRGRNVFAGFRIGIAVFLIIFFAIMPVGWPTGVSICAFVNTWGILCPSCGGTRAFASVMHLDFTGAIAYNPVVALLFVPVFLLVTGNDLYCLIRRMRGNQQSRSWIEYVLYGEMAKTMMGGDR